MANAGVKDPVVLSRVEEGDGAFGCNAAIGEYGDLMQMGIIVPTKVSRNAPQNAASVAALILTTHCLIAEIPQLSASVPMPGDAEM